MLINTGQLEHLQRRVQSRMDALAWVENDIKMKENYLNSLDNRVREREIIPMTNSMNDLTYKPDSMYQREEWAYMNQQPRLAVINEPIYTKEDDNIYPLSKHIERRRRRTSFLSVSRRDDYIY